MRTLLKPEHYGILFLDFDGVLHPDECEAKMFFCHMEKFSALIRDMQPHVAIVISSLWRTKYPLKALRKIFPIDIRDSIIDVTPVSRTKKAKRCEEIKAYLNKSNLENVHYAILDDHPEWFRDLRGIITCDPKIGLQDAQCYKLKQWFDYISDERTRKEKKNTPFSAQNTHDYSTEKKSNLTFHTSLDNLLTITIIEKEKE